MSEQRLTIRPMESGDTSAVLKLLRSSLGTTGSPKSPELWRWKHLDGPVGPSPALVAVAGSELVGLRALLRWPLAAGGRTVPAVRAVDTATHPDWRRQGIFGRLTRRLLETLPPDEGRLIFNTPNPRSGAGYLKMGWKSLGRVRLRFHLPRPFAALASAARRSEPSPPRLDHLSPVAELLRWPDLDALLTARESACGARLHTRHTADFLEWRYVRIPGFDYRCLFESRPGASAALICRGRTRGGLRELRLVEVLSAGGARETVSLVRSMVKKVCSSSGADFVAADSESAAPGIQLRFGPTFMTRPLGVTGSPDPTLRQSWRLSIGDLEVF